MPKNAVASETKTATFVVKQRAPKKNSVLFESTDPDALLQNIYVMRRGASEQLGVSDLDTVKELEITMKVKQ